MGLLDTDFAALSAGKPRKSDRIMKGEPMNIRGLLDAATNIPIAGDVLSGGLAVSDYMKGDKVGAAMNAASMLPFLSAGMIKGVWHGSPHKFDKFDMSKIGTGEGAQAYGHGLYMAESKDVGKEYQKTLASDGFLVGDKVFDPSSLQHMNIKSMVRKGDLDGAIEKAKSISLSDSPVSNMAANDLAVLQSIKNQGGLSENTGNLYKADLAWPDAAKEAATPLKPEDFLHWDKPLSEQSAGVKSAFNEFVSSPEGQKLAEEYYSHKPGMKLSDLPEWKDPYGETLYKNAFKGGWQNANDALMRNNVPGIRYLDGGSRGAGNGSYNYVIFQDDIPKIVERNGQPVGLLNK